MPVLNNTWFELYEDSNNLNNVIRFIEVLPNNLEEICRDNSFSDLLDQDYKRYGINYLLFQEALHEAKEVLNLNLELFKLQISEESPEQEENC